MTFFSYLYLENKIHFQGYLKYLLIFASLIALFLMTSLYLRHRLETKYRDLSIILLLLILFLVGVQYQQYQQNQVYANDTSRMVTFLTSVRDAQQLSPGTGRAGPDSRPRSRACGHRSSGWHCPGGYELPS